MPIQGDLTLFSDEDRRLWTRSVLSSVLQDREEESRQQQDIDFLAGILTNRTAPTQGSSGCRDGSETSSTIDRIDMKVLSSTKNTDTSSVVDFNVGKVDTAALEPQIPTFDAIQTWRQTLIQLRTMFPGGGNYSGVGVPLDIHDSMGAPGDGNSMYTRLLEMRENQARVMRSKMYRGEADIQNGVAHRPPNMYAGNLGAELADMGRDTDSDRWGSGDNYEDLSV